MKTKACASSDPRFPQWVEGETSKTKWRKPSVFINNVLPTFLTYVLEKEAL